MFLIMSASYIGQELQSEFGKIPPCFLPLGNRRLFQHQIKLAPSGVDTYISIPESYNISVSDNNWLESNKVNLIRIPDGASIGASLVSALNLAEHDLNSPVHILYGDTLLSDLPTGEDIICVSDASDSYDWSVVSDDSLSLIKDLDKANRLTYSNNIVNGYFKFSSPTKLIKSIIQCKWSFLDGVNNYNNLVGMTYAFSNSWLDFGHVNTYYRSKANFTTQRAFNELTITPDWIEKSSVKNSKIAAEAYWFEHLPFPLRNYIPQYLGTSENNGVIKYRLEYLHQTALNELYVFSELPLSSWNDILTCCIDFLKQCRSESTSVVSKGNVNNINKLFNEKTNERIKQYCIENDILINDKWCFNDDPPISISEIISIINDYLPTENENLSVLHGDFCFSNILYDSRADRIKVIDPRGITPDGDCTIFGDYRYDIAKLSHSVIGMYDWIIAGNYDLEIKEQNISFSLSDNFTIKSIQQNYLEMIKSAFDIDEKIIISMQIHLFLSMLPLHSDDISRQKALFANSFRLFSMLKKVTK